MTGSYYRQHPMYAYWPYCGAVMVKR